MSNPAPLANLPPVRSREPIIMAGSLARNMKWLETNFKQYENVCVALYDGELLCTGATLEDLKSTVDAHSNPHNVLLLKVGEHYQP